MEPEIWYAEVCGDSCTNLFKNKLGEVAKVYGIDAQEIWRELASSPSRATSFLLNDTNYLDSLNPEDAPHLCIWLKKPKVE